MLSEYAIVFPGQGSQSVGMLKDFVPVYPEFKSTFDEASSVLGYDLWDLIQNGPLEQLNQTEFTQPALLASGVAVWRIWKDIYNSLPLFLAGHSLGEYTALVCAESIDFKDAVKVVRERGRFMQEACDDGAMVAIIGLDDSAITKVCELASQGEILVAANYNSIGQTVLAGHKGAAERALLIAKDLGAKIAKILPVSVPSHSPLMQPASVKLADLLSNVSIAAPKITVIQNADVASYDDPDKIRTALVKQLYQPVRWVETIQHMVSSGIKAILECGPGKVLTGLNKRISGDVLSDFIGDQEKLLSFKQ